MTTPDPTAAPKGLGSEAAFLSAKNCLRDGQTIEFFDVLVGAVLKNKPTDLVAFSLDFVGKDWSQQGTWDFSSLENRSTTCEYVKLSNLKKFLNDWIHEFLRVSPKTASQKQEFHVSYLKQLLE
ncbi:hypothetical protein XU18_1090 [Perkinsela sp. CCAP 1560/4]|nr:hypothetical protein XU18_1090 [Perkinsela sp. CCAP 1560/4]|eukprot:KNH08377.1 hypothetical protein XU18_1090 [Perkinsela sp. CCAP 1560/4]